jgi:hypothetical protein
MAMRRGSCADVEMRAAQSLAIARQNGWLLEIALDQLTLARASLYATSRLAQGSLPDRYADSATEDSARSREFIAAAVGDLRRAGAQDHLPRGLLTRAWSRALDGDHDGARADLDEAWEIAERGPMRLHMADIHLHRARLFHAVHPYPWDSPHADLAAARALIERCGYWRRKEELEDAEAAARSW